MIESQNFGIINGISENAYAPNKSLTRGELAKMIVYTRGLDKLANEFVVKDSFKDISKHWARNYINIAADLGVLKGYEDGTFRPDAEVSNAEAIVMVLRSLGYQNLERLGYGEWYSGYTKRMYDIGINKGISTFKSFTSPAKRGDVAILWWNMLISRRWAVSSQSTVNGLIYTYSDQTQLQKLFPSSEYISGKVTGIQGNPSGDVLVEIGGKTYITDSDVPIYALGATGVGVRDKKENNLYGFSIDDEYSDTKIVQGPIFYLEDLGYNLNDAKTHDSYGSEESATYAYLLVSKETNEIFRVVYIDASNSVVIDSLKIEYDEEDDEEDEDEDENEDETIKNGKIFVNEEELATLDAIVIKNGKKVDWKDLEEGLVLTELIGGLLYTYENKYFNGIITDYTKMNELYIDGEKYIVSDTCKYTVFGDESSGDELNVRNYSSLRKSSMEDYTTRNTRFYFNVAEEICMIEFGKYKNENISDKYKDSEYQFLYITSIGNVIDEEDLISVRGNSPYDTSIKGYIVSDSNGENNIGDFLVLWDIDGKEAKNYYNIGADKTFDDFLVIYDCDDEFDGRSFGEYTPIDNAKIYKVTKIYKNNSMDRVSECEVVSVSSLEILGDLKNYKINLICDDEMNVEVIYAEKELNKTSYPVARVNEIKKVYVENSGDKTSLPMVEVTMSIIESGIKKYEIPSGECEVGELISINTEDDFKTITIHERFKTAFIGYEKDIVIESFDSKQKTAKIAGSLNDFCLTDSTYKYENKIYDLESYKYILSTVKKDENTGKWIFTSGKAYNIENLELKPGDRIAFGELNGVAVIYRGYTK